VYALPRSYVRFVKIVSGLTSLISVALWAGLLYLFDRADALPQFVTELSWVHPYGIRFWVGVDGISLVLILAAAVLFACVILMPSDLEASRLKEFYSLVLAVEGLVFGIARRSTRSCFLSFLILACFCCTSFCSCLRRAMRVMPAGIYALFSGGCVLPVRCDNRHGASRAG